MEGNIAIRPYPQPVQKGIQEIPAHLGIESSFLSAKVVVVLIKISELLWPRKRIDLLQPTFHASPDIIRSIDSITRVEELVQQFFE
jgi:hypothetical protein